MGQAGTLEELGDIEQLDDRVRQARELTRRFNHIFAAREAGLAERYLGGELQLVACRILSDAPKDGFVLSAVREDDLAYEDISERPDLRDMQALRQDIDVDKSPVLAQNVELVQLNQQRVSSRIRFQRFDDRTFGVRQPLYKFMRPILSSREGARAAGDWEIRVFGLTYAVTLGERCGEDIETASNNVDVSAKLNVERERERSFFDRYYQVVSSWRWLLFDNDFDVLAEPSLDPFDEGWQLGFGPINACFGV